MGYCTNCGTALDRAQKFCGSCGAPAGGTTPGAILASHIDSSAGTPSPVLRGGRVVWVALSVIVVAALGVWAMQQGVPAHFIRSVYGFLPHDQVACLDSTGRLGLYRIRGESRAEKEHVSFAGSGKTPSFLWTRDGNRLVVLTSGDAHGNGRRLLSFDDEGNGQLIDSHLTIGPHSAIGRGPGNDIYLATQDGAVSQLRSDGKVVRRFQAPLPSEAESFIGIESAPDGQRTLIRLWEAHGATSCAVADANGRSIGVRIQDDGAHDNPSIGTWSPNGERILVVNRRAFTERGSDGLAYESRIEMYAPDGKKVSTSYVATARLSGTNTGRPPTGHEVNSAMWANGGRGIVFELAAAQSPHITTVWYVGNDGEDPRKLIERASAPAWRP